MAKKTKSRWIFYLIYGVLVTMLVSTATMSGYLTTVSGRGTASVALVGTSVNRLEFDTEIKPGSNSELNFEVLNYVGDIVSEVNLDYSIEVTSTGNLPLTFSLSADNAVNYALTPDGDKKWSGGLLTHGSKKAHTYTLLVTWDDSSQENKSAELSAEIELVTVMLVAKQEQ